jgi:[ribosomal protein S5]-alanine N-acetyltransferase
VFKIVIFDIMMKLLPIKKELEENKEFTSDPLWQESLSMTIEFFKKIGYAPPWIGYFVEQDGQLVGNAAFKGRPVNGQVEIAYGTMEQYRNQGIGRQICKELVELSLKTDASVRITARTLPENNFSTRILKKNNFAFTGMVDDPEDGEVWEWEYKGEH